MGLCCGAGTEKDLDPSDQVGGRLGRVGRLVWRRCFRGSSHGVEQRDEAAAEGCAVDRIMPPTTP